MRRTWILPWAALAVLLPGAALAHTHLMRSDPADQAALAQSPRAATLVFAEPVTLTALRIESAAGLRQDIKPLPAGAKAELSVALPALQPGHYTLRWRVLSDDGHVVSGQIRFSVGGAAKS